MRDPDVALTPVLLGVAAIVGAIAVSIAAVFALLRAWGEPPGGARSGADSLVPALRAAGPALQSAPQVDAATDRAQRQASGTPEATR